MTKEERVAVYDRRVGGIAWQNRERGNWLSLTVKTMHKRAFD